MKNVTHILINFNIVRCCEINIFANTEYMNIIQLLYRTYFVLRKVLIIN